MALQGQGLAQLCEMPEKDFEIKSYYRECDLTNVQALNNLCDDVISNFRINQLINNAGIGGIVMFEDASPEYLDKIIYLNILAATMLTRMLNSELKTHPKAMIINIASVAAFGPLPYKTIYPASKAFIYSFSRSLSKEIRHTGVKVVAVTPGQIMTNPDVARRIVKQGILGKIGLLTACLITRLALEGAEHGKELNVPGLLNKANRFLLRWMHENWRLAVMIRVLKKEIMEVQ